MKFSDNLRFFYPRKHKQLVKRVLFDLKFWRRFITARPQLGFDYMLGNLPTNKATLACDASSSWGMAGVLTFDQRNRDKDGVAGLFWQINWLDWQQMATMTELTAGSVKINIAEFISALITCDTFATYCTGKITTLSIDNITAKAWLDTARCPRAPYDRCAQGSHLHRLKMNMKIKTSWIPSAQNIVADTCSRVAFTSQTRGQLHMIAGHCLRRISPKLNELLRYYK